MFQLYFIFCVVTVVHLKKKGAFIYQAIFKLPVVEGGMPRFPM